MAEILDLSNVINVSIQPSLTGLAQINMNTIGLISGETPVSGWDVDTIYKKYTNPSQVAADFGTGSEAYAIAVKVFGQQPNLLTTNGYLAIIRKLSDVPVAAARTIQGLTYTAATPGVAGNSITIIYVDDGTKGAETASVVGNAITVHMENGASIAAEIAAAIIASGPASALVDVSIVDALLVQADFTPALALQNGADASNESAEDCIIRTLNDVSYVGVLLDEALDDAVLLSLAEYIQTISKILFYCSNDDADLEPSAIFDDIKDASLSHTRCLYHGNEGVDPWLFAAAYAGRALSTDFSATNSTQTMNLKVLAGILPDTTIDQTILDKAKDAGVDVYVNFGVPRVVTSGGNQWFDQVYNELWFKNALEVAGFNYLAQTQTKIPQTEDGMNGLKNAFRKVCQQAVNNRFIGPGSWTSSEVFGDPASLIRNIKDIGYYVFSRPVADQSQEDREERIAPTVQIAVKTQGAFHRVNVIVAVNL